MSQLAVGYKESGSGRERISDGRMTHRGLLDLAGLRLAPTPSGLAISPINGRGLEIGFHDSNKQGYIWCFDRDKSTFYDLSIQARSIAIFPQAPGTLQLPASCIDGAALIDGTITTPKLAPNAVQQVLGMYQAAPTWSTTANNWLVTPVSVSVTTGGSQLRVEWSLTASQSAAGGGWLMGLGSDGNVTWGLGYATSYVANAVVTTSGVWYLTLPAGVHTVSMFVYNTSGGSTLSLYTGVYQSLHVTEQKR